jgi:hypothetical protein
LIEQLLKAWQLRFQMGAPGGWIPNFDTDRGSDHDRIAAGFDQ